MSAERGIVENTESGWAWVKTKRSDACSSCGSRHHCMVDGQNQMVVKVQNKIDARIGDTVELYLNSASKFKCIATVYLIPVFGLMAGAFSANSLSAALGINAPLGMFMFTVLGLAAGVLFMRHVANKMASSDSFIPKVKRIIARGSAQPV